MIHKIPIDFFEGRDANASRFFLRMEPSENSRKIVQFHYMNFRKFNVKI